MFCILIDNFNLWSWANECDWIDKSEANEFYWTGDQDKQVNLFE